MYDEAIVERGRQHSEHGDRIPSGPSPDSAGAAGAGRPGAEGKKTTPGSASGGTPRYPEIEALNDSQYHEMLVTLVNQADAEIFASHYTFDDVELVDAYSKAAKKGLDVRLVLDRGQQERASCNAQNARVVELIEAGVKIRLGRPDRSRFTVHQKTLLVDGACCVIGSGNATGNSRDRCYEFGICTSRGEVTVPLQTKLEKLWDTGDEISLEGARAAAVAKDQRRMESAQSA